MPKWRLKTPVVFLIFNRPDTTEKVFREIARARPPKLLVVADGPRSDHPGEKEKCMAARSVIERVDWGCKVLKNYSEVNLGCKRRVSSGLDWAFNIVAEAIILEDDCVPTQSFFRFCQELLDYYRDDTRVMNISGTNWQFGRKIGKGSYYFSKYNLIWGWATWKRAWKHYDVNMKTFPRFKEENQIRNIFRTIAEQNHFLKLFEKTYEGKIDTWDFQWMYSRLIANGLSILPNTNLIRNIGFREDATHTKEIDSKRKNNPAMELEFPLKHPDFMLVNDCADKRIFQEFMYKPLLLRLARTVINLLPQRIVKILRKIKKGGPKI